MYHRLLKMAASLLNKNKLSILIYHQVLTESDPMRPTEPTAEVFNWQMRLLRDYFTPLSLQDALHHLQNKSLPANAICVTFDDGYVNNLTVAQPILSKYGIPATVYVATGFSHGTNMWNDRLIHLFADVTRQHLQLDDERVSLGDWQDRRSKAEIWLKKLKYLPITERLEKISQFYLQNNAIEQQPLMMSPEQIKQLAEKDITIGAHTVNHPILKVIPKEQQQHEIIQSKQQLEKWIDRPVQHFAYPNGVEGIDFDDTTIDLVNQNGFASAVATDWGISTADTSHYKLKRFTPWDKTPLRFHLRLVRSYL
ncbi:polysaccharide deacetylase family protein [Rheinheimera salexigens]|uniref:polysaccharide deacetylase family protein n=1 Tax=Rheinheimera salexigens TaxID=1628148 RepID=UPI0009F5282E|nr:polysaccharide deacetylase family protein [Rheinheimera salexigens]